MKTAFLSLLVVLVSSSALGFAPPPPPAFAQSTSTRVDEDNGKEVTTYTNTHNGQSSYGGAVVNDKGCNTQYDSDNRVMNTWGCDD